MLTGTEMNELTHADRLQRELALTFARALHSHECGGCHMLRVCTVIGCEYRPFDRGYRCYQCRPAARIESAGDEVGGGDDEA